MKKSIFSLLLIKCFICSFAQHPYSFLLHKTYAQRFMQLDSLFYEGDQVYKDSVSLVNAADSIAFLAGSQHDGELYLEAQFIKWRYYAYSNIRKDYTYLRLKLNQLLKDAEQKNIKPLQIRIIDNRKICCGNRTILKSILPIKKTPSKRIS